MSESTDPSIIENSVEATIPVVAFHSEETSARRSQSWWGSSTSLNDSSKEDEDEEVIVRRVQSKKPAVIISSDEDETREESKLSEKDRTWESSSSRMNNISLETTLAQKKNKDEAQKRTLTLEKSISLSKEVTQKSSLCGRGETQGSRSFEENNESLNKSKALERSSLEKMSADKGKSLEWRSPRKSNISPDRGETSEVVKKKEVTPKKMLIISSDDEEEELDNIKTSTIVISSGDESGTSSKPVKTTTYKKKEPSPHLKKPPNRESERFSFNTVDLTQQFDNLAVSAISTPKKSGERGSRNSKNLDRNSDRSWKIEESSPKPPGKQKPRPPSSAGISNDSSGWEVHNFSAGSGEGRGSKSSVLSVGDSSREEERSSLIADKKRLENQLVQEMRRLTNLKATMKVVKVERLPDSGAKLLHTEDKLTKETEALKEELASVDSRLEQLSREGDDSEKVERSRDQWREPIDPCFVPHQQHNSLGSRFAAVNTKMKAEEAVTEEALKRLCDSEKLKDEVNDPAGLKVPLLKHQREALAWLLWRETQRPRGGILADDMGLGKTLTMISLVLSAKEKLKSDSKQQDLSSDEDDDCDTAYRRKVKGGTLVVAPSSVMGQWESEVKARVVKGLLYAHLHHGPKRDTKPHRLAVYDIVITSYKILQKDNKEGAKGPLLSMEWDRVILDEAHTIRNHKTLTAVAVCLIRSRARWALTGTPVHNNATDFFALLKFLRCKPFDDFTVWKRWVDSKDAAGMQRLGVITKSILLRRTKEGLKSEGGLKDLKKKQTRVVLIKLDPEETRLYEKIAHFSSTLLGQLIYQKAEKEKLLNCGSADPNKRHFKFSDGELFKDHPELSRLHRAMVSMGDVKTHEILVLLLRLRQICCHPALVSAMVDKEELKGEGLVDEGGLDIDLFDKLMDLKLTEKEEEVEESGEPIKVLSPRNPVFDRNRMSSKVRSILDCLKENILGTEDKAIVVSQWTGVLDILGEFLKREKVWYFELTGKVPVKDRPPIIQKFNTDPLGPQVLLLSLTAGGTGLNLVGANHLLLVDVHWNPQLEAQAADRIYRVGQLKPVKIYKFVVEDTIEERIEELQRRKLEIAEGVLAGASNLTSSKLTMAELRHLFNIR